MTRRSGVGLDRLVAGARARASHAKRDILSWPPISRLLGRTAAWETQRDTARRLTEDDPSDAAAWHQLGDALLALRERADADAAFARAVALAPESATTWKRGTSGLRTAEASARAAEPSFVADTLSRARPHWTDADVWGIHAGALTLAGAWAEAVAAADCALALDPSHVAAARIGIHARLHLCDWRRRDEDERRVAAGVAAGECIATPFDHRCLSGSEPEALRLATRYAHAWPPVPALRGRAARRVHQRLRIAYVSTDLRAHPVGVLLAGCLEQHDRSRFDITCVALRHRDGSDVERRFIAASDRFVDAHARTDIEVAALLRRLEVDVVVDLNGHSGARRPGVFARRPAPVQVTWLGYPGTTGTTLFDALIADPVVVPDEARPYYTEPVVYLPHTCLPADRTRVISPQSPTRASQGLPDTGMVFACFNNPSKIAPPVFDVWMTLLREVRGSVLWLRVNRDDVAANLRAEAARRGVGPERLVFAPRAPNPADHLARLRLADLFLDTLPYNAHATTIDALWSGLPVLTCMGTSFQGRVAASLLTAAGLPELITTSLADYARLARELASNAERLAALRTRLAGQRLNVPLFDTVQFTRDLERVVCDVAARAGLITEPHT